MVNRVLLSLLALIALLLGYIGVVRAQESTVPMIVVFHKWASFDDFRALYHPDERVHRHPEAWAYVDHNVMGAVQSLETALGFQADYAYSAALRGFAARLTAQQIVAIENNRLVAYVERDATMTTQAQEIPWGIDRIEADHSSTRAGDGQNAITNVAVFIIDTGIDPGQGDLNVVAMSSCFHFQTSSIPTAMVTAPT